MTILAHAAVAASLVTVCLASPQPQTSDNVWFFRHELAPGGRECIVVLDRDVSGWRLAFVWSSQSAGGFEARLSGDGAARPAAPPAGSLGTIELSPGTIHVVEVGLAAEPAGALPLRLPSGEHLAAASPAADGVLWLELPGAPALAFPLAGWREAMREVAACAS